MKLNLKKTWVVAFGLASTLMLFGCGTKTSPIGDFNAAMETYNVQTKAQLLDLANQSLKLAEQTNKNNQALNIEFNHQKIGHGNISLATDSVNNKEHDFKANVQAELNVKTQDKINIDMLKEAEGVDLQAKAEANVVLKDKDLFVQLVNLDANAKGTNKNLVVINAQKEVFKSQIQNYFGKWLKVDGEAGNQLVNTIKIALTQQNTTQASEIINVLAKFANISYLTQDGNETTFNKQPAYKLKLNEDLFFQQLADNINELKTIVEKNYDPMVIKDANAKNDEKITPEQLKEKIKVKSFEAYLVKFWENTFKINMPKLILDINWESVEISSSATEDKEHYTIKTKDVTVTLNVVWANKVNTSFDGKIESKDVVLNLLGSLTKESNDQALQMDFMVKLGVEKFAPFKVVEGLELALTNTARQEISNETVDAPKDFSLLSEMNKDLH